MRAKICVDYLSYEWSQSELILAYKEVHNQQSKLSFKQITRTFSQTERIKLKNEKQHLVRYQNAIWRQMSIKKRIDPSIIDWQKECDITWLYGPLYLSHDPQQTQQHSLADNNNTSHCSQLKPALKKYNSLPSQRFLLATTTKIPYECRSEPGKSSCVRFHPNISEVKYLPEAPPISKVVITTKVRQREEVKPVHMTHSVTSAIKVILLDKINMMNGIRVCTFIIWISAWFIYQTLYFLSWTQRQLMNKASCESHR